MDDVVGVRKGHLFEIAGAVALSELRSDNNGLDKLKVDQSIITTKDVE